MRTKLYQWVIAATMICGAMFFTACSSNDDNPVKPDGGAEGIAMIVKNGEIDYFRQIEKAFRDACKEKGLEAYYYATSYETAYEEQVAAVAELRKLGSKALKGIIFAPSYGLNGENAEAEVAALAKERGIPVVILDSPVGANSPLASCPYFGTDNTAAGKAMADMVLGDKVAVFAMINSPGIERAEAFKTLKPNAVVYQVADKANNEVQAVLDDYDDFVFFNGNDLVDAVGMLKAANKNVFTFDAYGEFLDELIAGSTFFRGIMAQNTFGMARKAVDAVLANAKQGEMVPTFFIQQYNLTDDNVKPFLEFYGKQAPVIEGLAEKLLGKWVDVTIEGEPMMTYDKNVVTFLSDTQATVSYSGPDFGEDTKHKWNNNSVYEIVLGGNRVALIGSPNKTITLVDEMIISSITDTEINCCYKHTIFRNNELVNHYENNVKMMKVSVDYRKAIVGTWECKAPNGEASETWRWKFKDDGNYDFFMKKGDGAWTSFDDEFSEYFVDGPMVYMRWKRAGEGMSEQRDWWEIVSLDGDKMKWTLYTQDDNGNSYTTNVELTKVE
jgi:ABC-type sugar transport system substrate-binding protein